MNDVILQATAVTKSFIDGDTTIAVLKQLDLQLLAGESVAVVGASGSGKSTLMQLLAGLDGYDEGAISLVGKNWQNLNAKQSAQWRNQQLGFVFQFHHLLAEFDAIENVAMPAIIAGHSPKQAKALAQDLLGKVGLSDRLHHHPSILSGGERQRVAIARALVNNPACVMMDEPTGNLDFHNAQQIQALLQEMRTSLNTAFVIVTHDENLAKQQARTLQLLNGKLLDDKLVTKEHDRTDK